MSRKTNLLQTLAVLAAATAPAHAEAPHELLDTARRAAHAVSPCRATADDLASEVTLRLWSRHRDVVERGDFRSYVDASVRNAWRDHLRKRRVASFTDLPSDDADAAPDPILPAPDEAPPSAVLEEFRENLEPADREVLAHLEAGHADRQIALDLGRTRHWVRTSVQRIRRQAVRHFGDEAMP